MSNNKESFEELLIKRVKDRILSDVKNAVFIKHSIDVEIPEDIIQKAWESINWEEVLDSVTKALQEKVIQTIINNILTEVRTDTKKLMSNAKIREKIRERVYPHLKKILDEMENGGV